MKKSMMKKISFVIIFAMIAACVPVGALSLPVYAGTGSRAGAASPESSAGASTKVKVKSVSVKAGAYSAKVRQDKVNYRKGTVTLYKVKELKKAGISKVKVNAKMYSGKKVTRSAARTAKLSSLSAKKNTIALSFPDFGKYTVTVKYYSKAGTLIKTVTMKAVGIVASEYSIAVINGTHGNLLFTMSLWDITKNAGGEPVPATVALSRPDSYDWNALPKNVYSDPLTTSPKKGSFITKTKKMSAYVASLYKLNKNSTFHLYIADNYAKGILDILTVNKIPESHYKVTMLSDGSGTYSWFNQTFGNANAAKTCASMQKEWTKVKKAYYKGKKIDCTTLKYSTSEKVTCLSKYAYPIVKSSSNVDWWVARTSGTFASTDKDFLNEAISHMTVKSLSGMLTNIQTQGNTAQFKKLFHFSDQLFSAAEKDHKQVMVIMGTRVNSEQNFEQFASFIKKYYGTKYEYYYKGHPATPTKLYPEKQAQLKKLGIHDVESSIAAELIFFFYPDIYCSGVSNSTLNSSYDPTHLGGFYGVRKAKADTVTAGTDFNFFFTKIDSTYEKAVTDLCKAGDDNFLVEFKDTTKEDIAIYDFTEGTVTYYKLNGDTYEVVK